MTPDLEHRLRLRIDEVYDRWWSEHEQNTELQRQNTECRRRAKALANRLYRVEHGRAMWKKRASDR